MEPMLEITLKREFRPKHFPSMIEPLHGSKFSASMQRRRTYRKGDYHGNGTEPPVSFVKTAGTTLLVAGLTGMGLAGCSSKGGASESAPAADGDFAWDEETDVLVVGAGLAGVAAAVTVGKESPDASCLLIEKGTSPLGNGNSPFSSGWFMYTSADREQAALDYLKELRHSDTGTPDDVLAAFATELTRNLDWIKELGAADTDLTIVPGTTDYACFPEYPELEHSAAIDYAAFTAEDSKWDHVTKFMNEVVGGLPSVTLKTECPLVALVARSDHQSGARRHLQRRQERRARKGEQGRHHDLRRLREQPRYDGQLFLPAHGDSHRRPREHRRRPPHLRPAERRRVAHEFRRRLLEHHPQARRFGMGQVQRLGQPAQRTSALP